MESPRRYSGTAMALHWLVAALIVAAFWLGWVMSDMPGLTPTKLKYFSWHKWLGVTIFMLAVLRLAWRTFNPAPPHLTSIPRWQQRAASAMHVVLYILIFVIPATGYLYSLAAGVPVVYLGLFPLPVLFEKNQLLKEVFGDLHTILNYTMAALVAIHAGAALKHHFIDRDATLARMLPFLR